MSRHRANDFSTFKLADDALDLCNLPRCSNNRLGSTRMTMTIRVLARNIDLEVLAMMMLDAANIVSTFDKLCYELDDERRLA